MFETLPTISQIVKQQQIFANKRLGQNFLFDQNITDKIVKMAGVNSEDLIIEIGPGPGGLTRSILKTCPKQLLVIEKDSRFIEVITQLQEAMKANQLIIYNEDALKIDYATLFPANKFKIIANLPYNIGTVLLFEWLKYLPHISQITVMLQLEVVERIIAHPGNKDFGRLAILMQTYFETHKLFELPPQAFYPPPKVTSAVITLIPREVPLFTGELSKLEKIVQRLFAERRKKISKALQSLGLHKEDLVKLNITGNERAEQLSLEQILTIVNLTTN